MTIFFGTATLAPLSAANPAALPPDKPQPAPDLRVAPAAGSADTAETGAERQGGETSAPPTAIQRKITEMLEQQAKELNPT